MKDLPFKRREFLRGGVRYGLLAGVAALTARAVIQRGDQRCTQNGVCGGCPEYTGCELPQALSARQGRAQGGGGGYTELRRIPGGKTPSRYLEIGPDDLLYVATGNTVAVLDQEGALRREIAMSGPVRCVTVDADGTVFAALRDRVEAFDAAGRRTGVWEAPGERAWISGLAVGPNDLFAADAGNRVILRYDRAGKLVGRIGEKNEERNIPGFVIPSPYLTVHIHPDGLLRVNNTGRHRIEAYTFDGDFEASWGKASGNIDGFCGCCNPIRLAVLPDGRFLTCEKGLPRVKLYSATGQFEAVVAAAAAFPQNAQSGAGQRALDATLAGLSAAVDSRGHIAILDHVTGEIRLLQPSTGGNA